MSAREESRERTGLRSTDDHGSWRAVYHQLHVNTDQHDLDEEVSDEST